MSKPDPLRRVALALQRIDQHAKEAEAALKGGETPKLRREITALRESIEKTREHLARDRETTHD